MPDPDVRRLRALAPFDMNRDYGGACQLSVKGRPANHVLSRAQRFGRAEPRRLGRRVQPGDHADHQTGGGGGDQRVQRARPTADAGRARRPTWPGAPSSSPAIPPSAASSADSVRNWERMLRRVAPSARRRPISPRRSSTEITMMFAIPIAPTSSATAPRPSSSVVNWPLAAARASSASDGRLTWTPSGFCGSTVGASRFETCVDLVDVGAHVDLRGVGLRLEQPLGHRKPDERGAVEAGVEDHRLHHADHVEPGVAEEHLDVAGDVADLQRGGRLGSEHDRRVALVGRVRGTGRSRARPRPSAAAPGRWRRRRCRRSPRRERTASGARSRPRPGRRPTPAVPRTCGRSSAARCRAAPRWRRGTSAPG